MNREEIVLAALSISNGALHSPVQVQKLFFLIDRNISEALGGPYFSFQPYNYGPFDKAVYDTLEELAKLDLVNINTSRGWKEYKLTEAGQLKGLKAFGMISPQIQEYIKEISHFVRSLSFAQLVSAIYKAYPEMRENSVFQD